MSLLAQCPRCGNTYVRRRDDTAPTITCRRCQFEFPVAAATPASSLPAPTAMHAGPVTASPQSADFEIKLDADHVFEVEQIEVLDEPLADDPWTAAEMPPAVTPLPDAETTLGAPQLNDVPALKPLMDLVDVMVSTPAPVSESQIELAPIDEIVVEPTTAPSPAATMDDAGAAEATIGFAQPSVPAPSFTEIEPPAAPLPPVRDVERPINIKLRKPAQRGGVPAGVWIGLGIGLLALFFLLLVLVAVLGSGAAH